MIPYHEPWADEAQAWLLARSLSPWQLVHTYLHYEGQPGLWHLLLWALIRLHASYTAMHWICGVVACCGIYVFLFFSPLPRWLKLTAPFTVFLCYQYVVVARNYVLVPLLLFAVAAVWKRSPIWVAVLLGLLANVAGHAAAIAAGFAIAYWLDQRQLRRRSEPAADPAATSRAAFIFLCFCILAMLTAFPTRDVYTAAPLNRTPGQAALGALVWGTWDPMPLGIPCWFLLVWGFKRRRAIHLLIPALALVAFSGAVYLSYWHSGLMVPVILAALWITWPASDVRADHAEWALRSVTALLIATQIGWTVHAAWYDHFHDYSPDVRTARFLKPYIDGGDQVAVTWIRGSGTRSFHLVGIEPYFTGKIFMNQATPFWWWSRHDRTDADFLAALEKHPAVVLAEAQNYEATSAEAAADLSSSMAAEKVANIEHHGYRLAHTFCGIKPERFSYRESVCYLVFLRSDSRGEQP
ncbi:MAG TPA: hypothetical protein VIY53_11805 [Acidobacteriaceae bacterium]